MKRKGEFSAEELEKHGKCFRNLTSEMIKARAKRPHVPEVPINFKRVFEICVKQVQMRIGVNYISTSARDRGTMLILSKYGHEGEITKEIFIALYGQVFLPLLYRAGIQDVVCTEFFGSGSLWFYRISLVVPGVKLAPVARDGIRLGPFDSPEVKTEAEVEVKTSQNEEVDLDSELDE